MKLEHLVYTSEPTRVLPHADLVALIDHAARKNAQASITGLLLYGGGHFMQLLEGPRRRLDDICQIISADKRHKNVQPHERCEVGGRLFPKWAMGMLGVAQPLPLNHMLLQAARDAAPDVPAGTGRSVALLREFRAQFSMAA